jgi:hypothetical protein
MQDAFAVIRWSGAGLAPSAISLLWSEAVAAEVIVFFLIGPGLLRRMGVRGAAALAAAAGIIRWSISGRDDLRSDPLGSAATTRIDFRAAPPCLHAHHGESYSSRTSRNRPSCLCLRFGSGNRRTDTVIRNALCQVWSGSILSDGNFVRRRSAVCLVRLHQFTDSLCGCIAGALLQGY